MIFEYWKCRVDKFPLISKVAKHIFALQASSAEPERLFSMASRLKKCGRWSISVEKAQSLMICNDNKDLLEIALEKEFK